MKRVALAVLVSVVFASQSFAILRPRFPAKPSPPFRGHIVIIEDDSIQSPRK
jgi:hypothetical protein